VTVLATLLYVGGGAVIVYALVGVGAAVGGVTGLFPWWGQVLYGGVYVGLARALQVGVRWAWRAALVLCGIGLAIAPLALIGAGLQSAIGRAVWPAVYLVLLTRPTVRAWFVANGGLTPNDGPTEDGELAANGETTPKTEPTDEQ
jgi:hypothetical protein